MEQRQRVVDEWHWRKVLNGLVNAHGEDVSNVFVFVSHLQCVGVKTPAMTFFAVHTHIGKKVHLNATKTIACTGWTTPFSNIKREAARAITAQASVYRVGKKLSDSVPNTDIARGARARCLTDRGLINLHQSVDTFPAAKVIASYPFRYFPFVVTRSQSIAQVSCHDAADEGTLAAATNPAYSYQSAQRNTHGYIMQIV